MSRQPSLLFVAPILPAQTGNGLAMRAGVFLDALAHDFQITLLIVPVAGGAGGRVPRFVAARTCKTITLSLDEKLDPLWEICGRLLDPTARAAALADYPRPALCRFATTPCLNEARMALPTQRFDVVHVMRSYLAAYAAPFLPGNSNMRQPFASVDLDDDEAATHSGLAALFERLGLRHDAQVEAAEAAKYERHEADWLPRFQQVITCSAAHAQKVASGYPNCHIATVPNTVALPSRAPRRQDLKRRILFVGNLSYLPNIDGIRSFANESLPTLRGRFGSSVVLRIAGSAPAAEVAALATLPGVELVANPVDLAKHYAWADLAVIPLRAGGGTRIKLIEAFAHGVPVVATRIGAEGVAAEDRIHLLLADSSEALADACAELLSDAELAGRLSASALQLVESNYAHDRGVSIIRAAFRKCYGAVMQAPMP
jgi:glycosyltransferase involved in cell wall biosynthesis